MLYIATARYYNLPVEIPVYEHYFPKKGAMTQNTKIVGSSLVTYARRAAVNSMAPVGFTTETLPIVHSFRIGSNWPLQRIFLKLTVI